MRCSWHEIGIYDLPAMIDHVLQTTGQKKLFYLGHSQGTTAFFVMACELPEYQSKIQAMFAMAPVAYCGRMQSPIMQFLARMASSINVRSLKIAITILPVTVCSFPLFSFLSFFFGPIIADIL